MFGRVAIYIALIISIILTYIFLSSKKDSRLLGFAQRFYVALPIIFLFASTYLLINILNHNYAFTYIWEYSNNQLNTFLLITSFFSGQEGSILLWGTLISIFGLIVRGYARKYGYEEYVLGFISLVIVFITLLLVFKSPFEYIWETFAEQNIPAGFKPQNGRGLNPILQNYWNMIHPPILFLGYASLTIPFVFALAALVKRDYQNWINIATPWALFSAAVLGLGIMLGGFWSYETLGWGGFWGWDPVENSSLMPWLLVVALIHSMIIQRKTQGLVKTNFLLAIAAFVFVMLATFLTRSGILGETSVHSFAEPGRAVYLILLIGLILFAVLGLVLFFIRFKDINKNSQKIELSVTSREFLLALGTLLIFLITLIVLLGTTWPITSELMSGEKSSIDISFYNKWNLPLAIIILILNGISLFFQWKATDLKVFSKQIFIPFIISIILTVVLAILKIDRIDYILLTFASIFSIILNGIVAFKILKKANIYKTGAMISHIGVAVMLFGVILSGGYTQSKVISLKMNEKAQAYGYNITYLGTMQVDKERTDQEKYQHFLKFEKNGKSKIIKSLIYWSDFNNWEQMFLEPGIKSSLTKDIYISPISYEMGSGYPTLTLKKMQSAIVPIDTSITFTLQSFDMTGSETNEKNQFLMGAAVEIQRNGEIYYDTLKTWIDMQQLRGEPDWHKIAGTDIEVGFAGMNPGEEIEETLGIFEFRHQSEAPKSATAIYTFKIEIKPFMWLVWIGAILIVIGFFISIPKAVEKNKTSAPIQKLEEKEE
ncbi:MAG TPA: cytochrome c biogenesis protein CcsA [Candidatus Kapabacteria bacterium]|jgi:cytochrome c-type biogenesis protein CcmF|nr:cytochrome c biogenesis protein CcsA [Candidatus Kapabacteria bacterium]